MHPCQGKTCSLMTVYISLASRFLKRFQRKSCKIRNSHGDLWQMRSIPQTAPQQHRVSARRGSYAHFARDIRCRDCPIRILRRRICW
jgi:hypothetical protein